MIITTSQSTNIKNKRQKKWVKFNLSWETVLKLGALGVCLIVALQGVFYFIFQIIGYDMFMLSLILIGAVSCALLILLAWRTFKKKLLHAI